MRILKGNWCVTGKERAAYEYQVGKYDSHSLQKIRCDNYKVPWESMGGTLYINQGNAM